MSRRGFTLVEVLVSAILVAMVAVAIARGTAIVRAAIRAAAETSLSAGRHLSEASHMAEAQAAALSAHSLDPRRLGAQLRVIDSSYAPDALSAIRPGRPRPIRACWIVVERGGAFAARWASVEAEVEP
jgi:prepilin-type N-terminal cleavage/methylation domain-containing protein